MKYLVLIPILLLPFVALATSHDLVGPSADLAGSFCPQLVPNCGGDDCGYQHILQLIGNIFTFITKCLAVPVATIVIAWGGIMMAVSPTDSGKRETGKKMLWAAVIGLVIVLAAWLIVDTLLDFFLDPNKSQFKNPLN